MEEFIKEVREVKERRGEGLGLGVKLTSFVEQLQFVSEAAPRLRVLLAPIYII